MRGGKRPNTGGARPGAGRKKNPLTVKRAKFALQVHPDTMLMLKARSAATGQSVTAIINAAILEYLRHGD